MIFCRHDVRVFQACTPHTGTTRRPESCNTLVMPDQGVTEEWNRHSKIISTEATATLEIWQQCKFSGQHAAPAPSAKCASVRRRGTPRGLTHTNVVMLGDSFTAYFERTPLNWHFPQEAPANDYELASDRPPPPGPGLHPPQTSPLACNGLHRIPR